MASQPTILVTAATGTQSSALIRALSSYAETNKTSLVIHATTRDPSSSSATSLQSANTNSYSTVKLFKSNFDDPATLVDPATNATHAFINVTPVLSDVNIEHQHAQNILSALRTHASATLRRIVYTSASSVRDPSEPSNYIDLDSLPWMKAYYRSKYGIETSVIDFATSSNPPLGHTILQPGTFLSNLLPPASTFMYPALSHNTGPADEQHLATTALLPDFKGDWLDPECIGRFALNALLLPDDNALYERDYKGKRVAIVAWPLTLGQVVESLNQYLASPEATKGGRIPESTKVKVKNLSAEEAEAQKDANPLVGSQLFQNKNQGMFGVSTTNNGQGMAERYGVELGSLQGFWEREGAKGRVASALGY